MPSTHEILSPLPGIFYRSASPGSPPYKSEGDSVAIGEVIGLIEVMKQFSEVAADVSGKIQSFSASNGEPVDPGQVLAVLIVD